MPGKTLPRSGEGKQTRSSVSPLLCCCRPADYMAIVRPIAPFQQRLCSCVKVVNTLPLNGFSKRGGDKVSGRAMVEIGSRGRGLRKRKLQRRRGALVVVNDIAGNYEEGFKDVDAQLMNYFTYKAVRTVLHQLYELNPPSYMWFYNFIATSDMSNGKMFLRKLVKEKQQLAERVMVTRLHLYAKWIKKCDHAKMYQDISNENLELMRERLIETVIWPQEDSNTETIG